MRRTDVQRNSKPASHQLYTDADQKAALEARNGLLQFDGAVSLGLIMAAMLASYLPARRAAAVDPVEVLRAE